MEINRVWAMPNKNTFTIKPINELIKKHFGCMRLRHDLLVRIDPFVNNSPFKDYCEYTNDIDSDVMATQNIDAIDFLKQFDTESVDLVLFDPPYSPRQVSECYKKLGKTVNMQTTQSSYWGNMKKEVSRIVRNNGKVITFGWNSGGIGKSLGFEIEEILIVPHGGWHNDTICTVDRKKDTNQYIHGKTTRKL